MSTDLVRHVDAVPAGEVYAEPRRLTHILTPLVEADAAREAIQRYEALKSAIVQDSDKQIFQQKVKRRVNQGTETRPSWVWIETYEERTFLKKSFWRRIATCFGLTLELISEDRIVRNGVLAYSVLYRAYAPNGQSMIGDGYCDSSERNGRTEHDIRATSHTRAKNRAISDLVGGGEMSAEEVNGEIEDAGDHTQGRRLNAATSSATQPRTAPSSGPARDRVVDASNAGGGDDDRATDAQMTTIRKFCSILGEAEPAGPLTKEEAKAYISILSQRYQEAQREKRTGKSEGAGQTAPAETKPWNALADTEVRQRLNGLGYRSVAQVEQFLAGVTPRTRERVLAAIDQMEGQVTEPAQEVDADYGDYDLSETFTEHQRP